MTFNQANQEIDMGGATDGFRTSPDVMAQKPFEELSNFEVEELQWGSIEYLKTVFERAQELGNERLLGAVAAFAFTKKGENPEVYRLINKAFPNQDWQTW